MNIKNFSFTCLNCKNTGVLTDYDKFEISGKYNGYPTVVCKECSKLSIYKVPIKYYLTKVGAIIFMAQGIYVAIIGTSPEGALILFSILSGIIFMFGHRKEIEVVQVIEVPQAMAEYIDHFKK